MKIIIVFFDVEGWFEAPFRRKFNFEDHIIKILKILEKYKVKAAFNTCGIVAENFPEIIERLHKNGHEIASHGYSHENFSQLSPEAINRVLEKTEKIILNIIDEKPLGIRAPWLSYDKKFYGIINRRGYKWASNQSFPHINQLFGPDLPSINRRNLSDNFLNMISKQIYGLKWRYYKKTPFKIEHLFEIPLISSMDGDLLGLMDTSQSSPEILLNFAYRSLINQYNISTNFYNINFHDWLIGSANRPLLLGRVLNYLSNQKEAKFILPRELVNLSDNIL